MKNIRYILLISVCCFLPNEGQAEINLTFNASNIVSSNPTLHTHHTPVELKPISNFKGIKLAATCFLPRCSPEDNYNLDYNKQCIDDGYSSSCPSGYVPDYSQRCPFNSSMFKCKPCSNSCPYGYSTSTCGYSQIQTGTSSNECGNTCYSCRNCYTSCPSGYSTSSCGYNQIQTGTSSNECGDTCYGCRDKNCGGYSLSSCPSNAYCSSCPDDGSLKKITSCSSGYVQSGNSCVNDTCPSGYSPVDNCEFGSQKKTTASGKVCYQCNSCTPSNCYGYDSYTCAVGADCDSCSQGCGLSAKYKFKSCQTGYYSSAGSCKKCGTNTSCSSGESLVNVCTNGKGDCANCRDENSAFNPCKGYFICDASKVGDGKSCDCGGITYRERCLVPETCNTDNGNYNGIFHLAQRENGILSGYYKVADKCTKVDGTKIVWTHVCTNTSLDGNGNYAPCKGKIDCGKDFAVGDTCSCGGVTYGTACATTCNYEETPQSCATKGKGFTLKCGSSEGNQYGICE